MRLELIEDIASLELHSAAWSQLALPSPMQSASWLLSWWQAYGEDNKAMSLSVVLAWQDDQLVGLAPFYVEHHPLFGKTLRWLGDGRASTDHTTLLTESAEHEPAVVIAIAGWVAEGATKRWHRLRLEAIDANDRAGNQFERLLFEAGIDTEWIDDIGSFPAPLASDWETYLAGFSKNRRKRLRRWEREWFDTGRVSMRIAKTEAEREAMWPELVQLHNERREGMGEQGVFDCPRFNEFHQLASARLLAEGKLYLGLLETDGVPTAIDYSPQDETTIYAYQGGISVAGLDQDAGHLCLLALVKQAIASGRSTLDLLRGDEPYKMNWRAEHLPARTLHARPRNLIGKLERWAGNTYRSLRDAKQQAKELAGSAKEG